MKIVIVGGGTAGWLAAILLKKLKPEHNIVVLESSKIGIVGVGESTTGFFTDVIVNDLASLGINHDDFMIETGAVSKIGIFHKAWTPDLSHDYFGPIDGSLTQFNAPDYLFQYALGYTDLKDIIKISHTGYLAYSGKNNMDVFGQFSNYKHSLQISGTETGTYLKKHCLKQPGVEHIDSEVVDVILKDVEHIKSLKLSNGTELTGDLFFDCSGFSRTLTKAVGAKWTSYKQWLPVDTAIPFLENYEDGEVPAQWTTAWAQKNGWMWQTPLLDRKGNGYVFDSNFCTPDQAQEEIETLLGRPINPVKVIKFDAGKNDRSWIGNCVSFGLAYQFLEPLESTNLHVTVVQLKSFISEYMRPTVEETINVGSMKLFNNRFSNQLDDLRDFIVMHYQGGRTDSEFWKYVSSGATRTEFVETLLETSKTRIPSYNDFPRYWGVAGWSIYCWVMAGIKILKPEVAARDFTPKMIQIMKQEYDKVIAQMEDEYSINASQQDYTHQFRSLRNQWLSTQKQIH